MSELDERRKSLVGQGVDSAIFALVRRFRPELDARETSRLHCAVLDALASAPAPTVSAGVTVKALVSEATTGATTIAFDEAANLIARLRAALHSQFEALDISREDAVYRICEDAIRALARAKP